MRNSLNPKRPWEEMLRHLAYIGEQLIYCLADAGLIYAVAKIHGWVEGALHELPAGLHKTCMELLCKVVVVATFVWLLTFIVAHAWAALKRLLHLFK